MIAQPQPGSCSLNLKLQLPTRGTGYALHGYKMPYAQHLRSLSPALSDWPRASSSSQGMSMALADGHTGAHSKTPGWFLSPGLLSAKQGP